MTGRADRLRTALQELEQERADYANQINELDVLIGGLKRQILAMEGGLSSLPPSIAPLAALGGVPTASALPVRPPGKDEFKNMSVRWGVLKYLGERGGDASSNEIANALEAGGTHTTGQRFIGNVSAVISVMKGKDNAELIGEGRYRLTSVGAQAWNAIRQSPKYLNRLSATAS